jgi:hypothetical protein
MEPAGRFAISGVTPGQYLIVARGTATSAAGPGRVPVVSPPSPSEQAQLWATQRLTVSAEDIDNVTLDLRPGVSVSGRIVFEATTAAEKPRVRITLIPVGTNPFGLRPASVESGIDGQFAIPGAPPGNYRLDASVLSGTAGSWALKSAVTTGGTDVLDELFVVGSDVGEKDIVVSFTDRPTELSGRVVDAKSRPVSEFFLVVFSSDARYRQLPSRRVVQTRPASDGTFAIANLPAGDYYLCAISEVDPAQLADPAFLEQLVPAAIRVTLAPGEKKRQDLRVGSGS